MNAILSSIEGEWRRYKLLADRAIAQVSDSELIIAGLGGTNSIAVIVAHLSGNLKSRFTDFMTSDGEKSWRDRDAEFVPQPHISRIDLLKEWEDGWTVLFDALGSLRDEDLSRIVRIRGEEFQVHEALLRLVTHTSYHVGQIVYLAKSLRGDKWEYLSIAPGKSQEFNRAPKGQRPPSR